MFQVRVAEEIKEIQMSYSYPKTAEEWWNNVDTYWDKLYDILARFIPPEVLKEKDPDKLRLNKDTDLLRLFNDAWWNAPDSPSIHYIPGWSVLCDLCSESYVLNEDLGNE